MGSATETGTPTTKHQICGSTLYLSLSQEGLDRSETLARLQKEAYLAGATPELELLDAGILGEPDGPTLYLLRANLKLVCCRCGSTQDINDNNCCPTCQLQAAA